MEDPVLEFAVRYYRWSLEQWSLEIAAGFPLLRGVLDDSATVYLRILARTPIDELLPLVRALAKLGHREAAAALGEPLSAEELDLISAFDRARGIEDSDMAAHRSKRWLRERGNPQREVRALLRKQIRPALEPILGGDFERWEGGEWVYYTKIGGVEIRTCIDLGSRVDLRYQHALWLGKVRLTLNTSALCWLGLGPTIWDDLSLDEVPGAVATLATACKRFIEGAPSFLP